jgi:hypothetical protein
MAMSNQRAATIAKLLVEEVFLIYGFPASLLSDRGTNFLSDLLSSVLTLFHVKKLSTTAYHPQTNGLTERFNATLTSMLSHFIDRNQDDWDSFLPYVLFAYRTSNQEFLNQSPFFCLFGRSAHFPDDISLRAVADRQNDDEALPFLEQLKKNFEAAHQAIDHQFDQLAEKRSKAAVDMKPAFYTGDTVLLYSSYVPQGKMKKLSYQWEGPFMILDVFNNGMNYKIQRLNNRKNNLLQLNNNATP